MVLAQFLKQLVTPKKSSPVVPDDCRLDGRRRVLNVGGASKDIPIPAHYTGWNHLLLDIDARRNPDVLCDARELELLEANQFDAIYCSHNLEHYYKHDGARVLRGFLHVLKADGFAEVAVPDLKVVVFETKLDSKFSKYQDPHHRDQRRLHQLTVRYGGSRGSQRYPPVVVAVTKEA